MPVQVKIPLTPYAAAGCGVEFSFTKDQPETKPVILSSGPLPATVRILAFLANERVASGVARSTVDQFCIDGGKDLLADGKCVDTCMYEDRPPPPLCEIDVWAKEGQVLTVSCNAYGEPGSRLDVWTWALVSLD